MSGDGLAGTAARLARRVGALGDPSWTRDLQALAGPDASGDGAPPPTYGEVARAGTALVARLGAEGRWDDAVTQARHLKRFFARVGMGLGPITVQAFDGLLAASMARDPDELGDFVELVQELFP